MRAILIGVNGLCCKELTYCNKLAATCSIVSLAGTCIIKGYENNDVCLDANSTLCDLSGNPILNLYETAKYDSDCQIKGLGNNFNLHGYSC
jgi:hypothetical protein